MHRRSDEPGFGPGTYGQSFAEVYDRWYPADDTTAAAVAWLCDLAGGPARILELGVGTGRLALPLARRGHRVTGMDASAEMLELLTAKSADLGAEPGAHPDGTAPGVGTDAPEVTTLLGDVGDPDDWPDERFDLVVAACNLVFNLVDAGTQAACFAAAARVLEPDGRLVVDAFLPAPLEHRERRLEVREVTAEGVVLIATDSSPLDGVVTGQHIELVDGQPVRLRPWRIRVAEVAELDAFAYDAGLELVERHADWSGSPFDAHGAGHVSVYRRG